MTDTTLQSLVQMTIHRHKAVLAASQNALGQHPNHNPLGFSFRLTALSPPPPQTPYSVGKHQELPPQPSAVSDALRTFCTRSCRVPCSLYLTAKSQGLRGRVRRGGGAVRKLALQWCSAPPPISLITTPVHCCSGTRSRVWCGAAFHLP